VRVGREDEEIGEAQAAKADPGLKRWDHAVVEDVVTNRDGDHCDDSKQDDSINAQMMQREHVRQNRQELDHHARRKPLEGRLWDHADTLASEASYSIDQDCSGEALKDQEEIWCGKRR
jgi:hypothetical protein